MPQKTAEDRAAYKKAYHQTAHYKAIRKARYHADRPGALAKTRAARLARVYGITEAQYDQLLLNQGGVCAICLKPPRAKRLAVDHCHATGVVRGLLCPRCNSAIGRFQDRADTLRRAASYLETPPARLVLA